MNQLKNSAESYPISKNEIDIFEFGKYILSKIKIIISVTLAVMILVGASVLLLISPIYEATAQMYVLSSRDSAVNLSDLQIGSYLTSDYKYVFDTWEVNEQVIANLGLSYTVDELRDMCEVSNPTNTRLLFITVSSKDAKEAATIANEFVKVASTYISDVMNTDKPSMLSQALEPLEPERPRKLLSVVLSAVVSVVVCVFIFLFIYVLNDKVKTKADIQKHFGMTPLAVIPIADLRYSKHIGR